MKLWGGVSRIEVRPLLPEDGLGERFVAVSKGFAFAPYFGRMVEFGHATDSGEEQ